MILPPLVFPGVCMHECVCVCERERERVKSESECECVCICVRVCDNLMYSEYKRTHIGKIRT